jgi:hypothetical protein
MVSALARRVIAVVRTHPFIIVPPLFYLATLAPSIGLGDTAMLVDAIQNLTLSTHVNNHNLTVLTGRVFSWIPVGNYAFRANLVSAFYGSLTVLGFYWLLYYRFRHRLAAALSAALFMVSHSLWWHSTLSEVYALNAFLTMAAIWLIVLYQKARYGKDALRGRKDRWNLAEPDRLIIIYAFLAGLAFFNHIQMGILTVSAFILLLDRLFQLSRQKRSRRVMRPIPLFAYSTFAFIVGLLPYLLTFFLRDVKVAGSVAAAFRAATGGDFQQFMFKGSVWNGLKDEAFLLLFQFPHIFLLFIPAGIYLIFRRWGFTAALWALLLPLVIDAYFFSQFSTWDRFAFLLPVFVITAFFGGYAVCTFFEWAQGGKRSVDRTRLTSLVTGALVLSLIVPPYLYGNLSRWGSRPDSYWYPRYNNIHGHNSHNISEYLANPNKRNYRDVDTYANLIFSRLPANAMYIDDDSRVYYPIEYFRKYYGHRPDLNIQIINSWGFANWGLDRDRFAQTLDYAFTYDKPLFLITTAYPFQAFIQDASRLYQREYHFIPYRLDNQRWIYRLATAHNNQTSRGTVYTPEVIRLKTGLNFNLATGQVVKSEFQAGEPIMTMLDFQANGQPFPLAFTWRQPDGNVYSYNQPGIVATGNTGAWSFLQKQKPVVPGKWKVEALVEGKVVAEQEFTVK